MAPLPRATEEAVIEGLRRKRNPTQIHPEHFFEDAEAVRRQVAELVGGDSEGVALLPSTSYGVAICARNLPVDEGRNLVLTHEQFPGNVYAWRERAIEVGAELRVVAPADDPDGRGRERWTERILRAIDRHTAVVSVPHVHWTDGAFFDLEAIGEAARDVGAWFVVDATQSLGAFPFDISRIRPDAVISSAYKWLFGPYGVAVAWFGERVRGGTPLEETWIGRLGSEDFQGLVDYEDRYQPGARRFDVGEAANFALLPGVKASLDLVLEWGPVRVQEYCRSLMEPLSRRAEALGFQVDSRVDRPWHIVGIRMRPDVELSRLKEEMDRAGVVASLRGSALRVSCHVYNDRHDIEALEEILARI